MHLLTPNFVRALAAVACWQPATLLHLLRAITVQSQGAYSIASDVSCCLADRVFQPPIQACYGSRLPPIILLYFQEDA